MPSGPAAKPFLKLLMDLKIVFSSTMIASILLGGFGKLISLDGVGCLSNKALNVSSVSGAKQSSEHNNRKHF